jgi:DNA polymerase eta
LAFTGIDVAEAGQQSIEGFLKPLSNKKRPRDPDTDTDIQDRDPPDGIVGASATGSLLDNSTSHQTSFNLSYDCSRCGKSIRLPTADHSSEDQEKLILKVKMEHDDFHFAQDLAKEGNFRSIISVSEITQVKAKATKPAKKRKPSPEPKGIEKFFRK